MRKITLFLTSLLMSMSICGCSSNKENGKKDNEIVVNPPVVNKVTVTFDYDGGTKADSDPQTLEIEEGSSIATLPAPTKEGFTFLGWFNGADAVSTTTLFNENVTIKAKWEEVIPTGYNVTFDIDSHVQLTVYRDKLYIVPEGTEQYQTRNKEDSEIGKTDAQVNFTLVFDAGYVLDTITFTQSEGTWAGNIKEPAETDSTYGYRVTKITGDGVVKVTSKVKQTTPTKAGWEAVFMHDNHVKVVVYQDKKFTTEETGNEYLSRNKADGAIGKTDAQINFQLVFDEGYELDGAVTATGTYSNLKTQTDLASDTNKENVYRLTKMQSNSEITVRSKEKVDSGIIKPEGFEVVFLLDSRITNLKVFKDKNFTTLDDSTIGYFTRNKDTNEYTKTDGQIKFSFTAPEGADLEVSCTAGTYKNKDVVSIDGMSNCYKFTKITSDTVVTIKVL